jgi:hypothetical protein
MGDPLGLVHLRVPCLQPQTPVAIIPKSSNIDAGGSGTGTAINSMLAAISYGVQPPLICSNSGPNVPRPVAPFKVVPVSSQKPFGASNCMKYDRPEESCKFTDGLNVKLPSWSIPCAPINPISLPGTPLTADQRLMFAVGVPELKMVIILQMVNPAIW